MKTTTENSGNFSGKKVVIIGGSSGIGFSTAKALLIEDGEVVILSSNKERLNKALGELQGKSYGFTLDVTDESQLKNAFKKIGAFDHLVFTAGENIKLGLLQDTEIEMARNYFKIRYWGALMAVKYATPYLHASGSIVLTSGIASNRPGKGWSLGASVCAAMEGFTRAMSVELAPIRVNAVSPGVVKTDLWNSMSEEERQAMYLQLETSLPLKKVGLPDDIAKTYLYLMSQSYGTGQTIIVDGGASLS